MDSSKNDVVVSGMRPTGKLHLGNYFGALKNFVDLQDKHKCFFFVADLHALTTAADNPDDLASNSIQMVIDWLAAGLNPEKCSIFIQSHVPEISELSTLLGMITPLGWLLRNPTYKDQLNELFRKKYAGQLDKGAAEKMAMLSEAELSEMSSFGFLGYPVLMATDILIHKAAYVPVGEDQTAHVEIARSIARRFNDLYKTDTLVEPKPLFTKIPKVPGLDGRKMSKSYGNSIELGEEPEAVRKKIMTMFTDPNKKRANDPANPEGCSVFAFHKIYNPDYETRAHECREGCFRVRSLQKTSFELMEKDIKEFNERRNFYASDKGILNTILKQGAEQARQSAAKTLREVKDIMKVL